MNQIKRQKAIVALLLKSIHGLFIFENSIENQNNLPISKW